MIHPGPFFFRAAFLCSLLTISVRAYPTPAEARDFMVHTQKTLSALLRKPSTSSRRQQMTKEIKNILDYDELTRRAFGQPCPRRRKCTDHWKTLKKPQKKEIRELLAKLIEKNYKKNLKKILDYDVIYKEISTKGDVIKIRTEARSKLKRREPPVQIDYMVRQGSKGYQIIDVVTEGSVLTKNYYDQFHRMLTDPKKGYPSIVRKLNQKIRE